MANTNFLDNKQMKKLSLILISTLFVFNIFAKTDPTKQLIGNTSFGWDVYNTNDYRWRNISLGSAYAESFPGLPNAYWSVGARINWGKYTIYPEGNYGIGGGNATLKTTSLSLPTSLGYQVVNSKGFRLNLYTGPTLEMILNSKLDGYPYDKLNYFQVGWNVGSSIRMLYLFNLRIGYSYYPISVFSDNYMPRKAFSVSFGF